MNYFGFRSFPDSKKPRYQRNRGKSRGFYMRAGLARSRILKRDPDCNRIITISKIRGDSIYD